MKSDTMYFEESASSSPRTYRLEELTYDGRRRNLAISLWSIVALGALVFANWTTSAIINLDDAATRARLASATSSYDRSYDLAQLLGILLFYGFLILFVVAAYYALRALCIPRVVRIYTMRYSPDGKFWTI